MDLIFLWTSAGCLSFWLQTSLSGVTHSLYVYWKTKSLPNHLHALYSGEASLQQFEPPVFKDQIGGTQHWQLTFWNLPPSANRTSGAQPGWPLGPRTRLSLTILSSKWHSLIRSPNLCQKMAQRKGTPQISSVTAGQQKSTIKKLLEKSDLSSRKWNRALWAQSEFLASHSKRFFLGQTKVYLLLINYTGLGSSGTYAGACLGQERQFITGFCAFTTDPSAVRPSWTGRDPTWLVICQRAVSSAYGPWTLVLPVGILTFCHACIDL